MAKIRALARKNRPDWYLKEWMSTLHISQAELARRIGKERNTINNIYHGKTEYYREILNEICAAIHIAPFEILMPPDEAMALRRIRESSLRIAADSSLDFKVQPADINTRKAE